MFVLTDADLKRLEQVLQQAADHLPGASEPCRRAWQRLAQLMCQAVVVPSPDIPGDVVTLESRLVVRDRRTGRQRVFRVHLPENPGELVPLLAAVLGHRIGDTVECGDPPCDFELERMNYQPESAFLRTLASSTEHIGPAGSGTFRPRRVAPSLAGTR